MSVTGLDHVNLRTADLAGTVAFYEQALGLRYDTVGGQGRHWLYDTSGSAIVHLIPVAPNGGTTGALDHIALTCLDLPGTRERLTAEGIAFTEAPVPALDLTLIRLTEPNGVLLELVFRDG